MPSDAVEEDETKMYGTVSLCLNSLLRSDIQLHPSLAAHYQQNAHDFVLLFLRDVIKTMSQHRACAFNVLNLLAREARGPAHAPLPNTTLVSQYVTSCYIVCYSYLWNYILT